MAGSSQKVGWQMLKQFSDQLDKGGIGKSQGNKRDGDKNIQLKIEAFEFFVNNFEFFINDIKPFIDFVPEAFKFFFDDFEPFFKYLSGNEFSP